MAPIYILVDWWSMMMYPTYFGFISWIFLNFGEFLADNWPDGPLTTVTLSLPITDPTGLTQSDTASSAGPITQGTPEPSAHQAGGDQQHQD